MRLVLLLSLLSFPVFAQTQLYFEEQQSSTRSAPTTNPAPLPAGPIKPLALAGFTSFRLTVCPQVGQSLDGVGTIRLYLWVSYIGGATGRWTYNPSLDRTITISTLDMCQTFAFKVDVSSGYLLPATQGVTTSSGNVIVRVDPSKY